MHENQDQSEATYHINHPVDRVWGRYHDCIIHINKYSAEMYKAAIGGHDKFLSICTALILFYKVVMAVICG